MLIPQVLIWKLKNKMQSKFCELHTLSLKKPSEQNECARALNPRLMKRVKCMTDHPLGKWISKIEFEFHLSCK